MEARRSCPIELGAKSSTCGLFAKTQIQEAFLATVFSETKFYETVTRFSMWSFLLPRPLTPFPTLAPGCCRSWSRPLSEQTVGKQARETRHGKVTPRPLLAVSPPQGVRPLLCDITVAAAAGRLPSGRKASHSLMCRNSCHWFGGSKAAVLWIQ